MSQSTAAETVPSIAKGQVWSYKGDEHHASDSLRRVKAVTAKGVHLVPVDLPETQWFLSPFATEWEPGYFLEHWTLVSED
jgi:hypothetical protein